MQAGLGDGLLTGRGGTGDGGGLGGGQVVGVGGALEGDGYGHHADLGPPGIDVVGGLGLLQFPLTDGKLRLGGELVLGQGLGRRRGQGAGYGQIGGGLIGQQRRSGSPGASGVVTVGG